MTIADIQMRLAVLSDVDAIAVAHRDSIQTLGPGYYPPSVVDDWQTGLRRD